MDLALKHFKLLADTKPDWIKSSGKQAFRVLNTDTRIRDQSVLVVTLNPIPLGVENPPRLFLYPVKPVGWFNINRGDLITVDIDREVIINISKKRSPSSTRAHEKYLASKQSG